MYFGELGRLRMPHPSDLPLPNPDLLEAESGLKRERAREIILRYSYSMRALVPNAIVTKIVNDITGTISVYLTWGAAVNGNDGSPYPRQGVAVVASPRRVFLDYCQNGHWDYFESTPQYRAYINDPSQQPPAGIVKGSIEDQLRLALEPEITPRLKAVRSGLRRYLITEKSLAAR